MRKQQHQGLATLTLRNTVAAIRVGGICAFLSISITVAGCASEVNSRTAIEAYSSERGDSIARQVGYSFEIGADTLLAGDARNQLVEVGEIWMYSNWDTKTGFLNQSSRFLDPVDGVRYLVFAGDRKSAVETARLELHEATLNGLQHGAWRQSDDLGAELMSRSAALARLAFVAGDRRSNDGLAIARGYRISLSFFFIPVQVPTQPGADSGINGFLVGLLCQQNVDKVWIFDRDSSRKFLSAYTTMYAATDK